MIGGGFSNVRTLEANGAPPKAFRGLTEDHFGLIVADADRSLRSPEGRLSEEPAWGPLRSTEGVLKPTEHLLR